VGEEKSKIGMRNFRGVRLVFMQKVSGRETGTRGKEVRWGEILATTKSALPWGKPKGQSGAKGRETEPRIHRKESAPCQGTNRIFSKAMEQKNNASEEGVGGRYEEPQPPSATTATNTAPTLVKTVNTGGLNKTITHHPGKGNKKSTLFAIVPHGVRGREQGTKGKINTWGGVVGKG